MRSNNKQAYEKYLAGVYTDLNDLIGIPVVIKYKHGYTEEKGVLLGFNQVFIEEEELFISYFSLKLHRFSNISEIPENKDERLSLESNLFVPFDPSIDVLSRYSTKEDKDIVPDLKLDVFVVGEEDIEKLGTCYSCDRTVTCHYKTLIEKFLWNETYGKIGNIKAIVQRVWIALASECKEFERREERTIIYPKSEEEE